MNCVVQTAREFVANAGAGREDCRILLDHLTRSNSDFQQKLLGWIDGSKPAERDGHIAVVRDHGEIIGWARTEHWWEMPGEFRWDTLEAFVARPYRNRGVATFAAAGLTSGPLASCGVAAVFSPSMLLVARRVGLSPALFETGDDGRWVAA